MARRRLDSELVRRGLARSREHARELIESGVVLVKGGTATKPATQVEESDAILVTEVDPSGHYVSRGAHKLIGALDVLRSDTQLLVISHQRRTMEDADVLYGVSMQADGVSRVVSQKLDRETGKVVNA